MAQASTRERVAAWMREADRIFIGRVLDLTTRELKVEQDGQLRDEFQLYPRFEVIEMLKGDDLLPELHWLLPRIISIGCPGDPLPRVEFGKTFRYLVYARENRILYASPVIDWPRNHDFKAQLEQIRTEL